MNNSMLIYYFSATGNSLSVALSIANINHTQTQLVEFGKIDTVSAHPNSTKVGFVFPVYMGVLPQIVRRFLKSFPVKDNVYYFAIATYYTYKGVALSEVEQLLRSKGVRLNYGNTVPTVGTCLMKYEVPEYKREKLLSRAKEKTTRIVRDIETLSLKRINTHCSFSILWHQKAFQFFFKEAFKKFSVDGKCVNCGVCREVCPTGNISCENSKPVWGNHCLACHACVHWCPKNAIHLGGSKGRLSYHNPDITYPTLIRYRQTTTSSDCDVH